MALIRSSKGFARKSNYPLIVPLISAGNVNYGCANLSADDVNGFSSITVSNAYGSDSEYAAFYHVAKNDGTISAQTNITVGTPFTIPTVPSDSVLVITIRVTASALDRSQGYSVALS